MTQSLLKQLEDLGDSLVSADLPVDVRKILGALVHYVDTGSLAPVAAPPERETVDASFEQSAENERLRDRIAELEAQASGQTAPTPAGAAVLPEASQPAVDPAAETAPPAPPVSPQ